MRVCRALIYPLRHRSELHRGDFGPRRLPSAWIEAREALAARPFDDTQAIGAVFDKAMATMSQTVSRNSGVLRGVPCLRGTRIPIYQICGLLGQGMSIKKVARALSVSEEQVKSALRFASIILEQ